MTEITHDAAATVRAAGQGAARTELRTALTEERRGYVARGRADRIEQVDAQLATLDGDVTVPDESDGDASEDPAGDKDADSQDGDGTPETPPVAHKGRGSARAATAASQPTPLAEES